MTPIAPISAAPIIEAPSAGGLTQTPQGAGAGEFRSLLNSAMQHVSSAQNSADAAVQSFLNGETDEIHSTILATQRADLEFEMFIQVRNKVVSAYQEIMRMQV
ncbi:MAG TPA: flagellar hook-basal body complex protein FliE [Bryobacteraceae bacterium]|nr:flagellar hook-basal body complex protein FliE [Bryobacteraceae bacterium]